MITPCIRRTSWSTAEVDGAPVRRTSTASDSRIGSPTISRPACRSVVPVETTSAITSATPSRTAVSTAPSSRTTSASTPCSAKCFASSPPYDVATRLPAKSATDVADPGRAAKRKVDSPKPSGSSSSAGAPLSSSRSRPVMPTSSSPEPT